MPARLLLEIGNSTVKLATADYDGRLAVERYSNLEALLRRIEAAAAPIVAALTGGAHGADVLERLGDAAEITLVERSAFDRLVGDSYDTPATLGLDRILNLAGLDSDAVVISCGTAITVDALSNGRCFWGAILPGFTTAADGLHARIPRLPLVSTRMPTSLPARDSLTSVSNGVLLGAALGAQGIAADLATIAFGGGSPRTVLTGGEAEVMKRFWRGSAHVSIDDALLFRGMLAAM